MIPAMADTAAGINTLRKPPFWTISFRLVKREVFLLERRRRISLCFLSEHFWCLLRRTFPCRTLWQHSEITLMQLAGNFFNKSLRNFGGQTLRSCNCWSCCLLTVIMTNDFNFESTEFKYASFGIRTASEWVRSEFEVSYLQVIQIEGRSLNRNMAFS